jgi:glucose/arabinose dehydrogenase
MGFVMKSLTLFVLCSAFLAAPIAFGNPSKIGSENVHLIKVFTGLEVPWGMAFLDNRTLLVTEKEGNLYKLNLKDKSKVQISGLPEITVRGQGGLLDVALDPDFKSNQFVYLSYGKKVGGSVTTALAKAKLAGNKLDGLKDIFVAKTDSTKGVHFGSRITFDDQYLYLSIGDRGHRHRSQMLDFHNGKIIRLNKDGSVPKDNPFVGKAKALPEIYSYGHRNPQGLFFDPKEKVLFTGEHGPRGGDEINIVKAGKNYGWPIITYGKEYWGPSIGEGTKKMGMIQPEYYYVPSIAPCGMIVYSGKKFKSLKGTVIQGALKLKHLNFVQRSKSGIWEEKRYFENIGRVRAVTENLAGEIFFSTDSGQIYMISDMKKL